MKLLLDQGLPRSAVILLQDRGFDVLHVADIGLSTAEDSELLKFAQQDQRVIITFDADFHQLLALSQVSSPSVIRIRIERLRGNAITELLCTTIPQCQTELEQGAVVSIEPYRIRVHGLPLS